MQVRPCMRGSSFSVKLFRPQGKCVDWTRFPRLRKLFTVKWSPCIDGARAMVRRNLYANSL